MGHLTKATMRTTYVKVLAMGTDRLLWEMIVKDTEWVRVGYQPWGVVIDISDNQEDLEKSGCGLLRKIFSNCVVMEECERIDEEEKE